MTWFKVDDNLAFHPKAVMAGNAAMGLWVRSGSWVAQQLTDGFVPLDIVRSIGSGGQSEKLVEAGLWLPCGKGFEFHEWAAPGRQPTRAQVEQKRETAAKRLQKWREKHGDETGGERGEEQAV